MQRLLILLVMLCFSCFLFAKETIKLLAFHIEPAASRTRLLFELNEKTKGVVKSFPKAHRIVIDFEHAHKAFKSKKIKLVDSQIKAIRIIETAQGTTRFILTVNEALTWKIKFLPKSKPVLLQIDFYSIKPQKKLNLPPQAKSAGLMPKLAALLKVANNNILKLDEAHKSVAPKLTEPKKLRTYTVVIDPRHGGKDPGALGKRGTKEKNIVLSIAKKLAREINAKPQLSAILTRDKDIFLPLRKRTALARSGNALVFVAIHADAFFDNSKTGATVFALSKRGATSEAARWLAKRENNAELGGVELDALKDRSILLRSVLIDLAQTATIRDSLRLGNKILDALDDISNMHTTKVEQAPFAVLKSPDIPSVLVETGFITNPKEEKKLASSFYQDKLAKALARGIEQYINQYAVLEEN